MIKTARLVVGLALCAVGEALSRVGIAAGGLDDVDGDRVEDEEVVEPDGEDPHPAFAHTPESRAMIDEVERQRQEDKARTAPKSRPEPLVGSAEWRRRQALRLDQAARDAATGKPFVLK